jgi:very-long-chain ceramide synthase
MAEANSQVSSPVDDSVAVGAAKAAARPHLKHGSSSSSMNGPLYMQSSGSNVVLVRRLKRKEEGTGKQLMRWAVENQIGVCCPPRSP